MLHRLWIRFRFRCLENLVAHSPQQVSDLSSTDAFKLINMYMYSIIYIYISISIYLSIYVYIYHIAYSSDFDFDVLRMFFYPPQQVSGLSATDAFKLINMYIYIYIYVYIHVYIYYMGYIT